MIRILFALVLASVCFAQAPSSTTCLVAKYSITNSINMKSQFSGRTGVFQAYIEIKNYCLVPMPLSGIDIDLSMGTLNTLPSDQANALLRQTFNKSFPQRLSRDSAMGIGIIGALQATKIIAFSSPTLGILMMAFSLFQQYFLPSVLATQLPLPDFANDCGKLPPDYVLLAGKGFGCNVYIQKPPKGSPQLAGAGTFPILTGPPPTFSPTPQPEPVQLKPPPVKHSLFHRAPKQPKELAHIGWPVEGV